jgi:thiol-disulfide isomerase/thioredoxin
MNHPKKIFTAAVAFLLPIFSFAQLQQGVTAPDWTLTDLNKKVWHLYDLTAQGKTVFIDVSATWCGPCWRYHRQRSLDSLYEEHGPNGTIDQSCYVFLLEGDGTTTYSDLIGTGKKTTGNWVKGTDFPILDPGSDTINPWRINYNITYFPTIYMICPNNTIYLVGPGSESVLFQNTKSGCPPPVKKDVNKMNFISGEDHFKSGSTINERIEQPINSTPLFHESFFIRKKRFSIVRKKLL